MITAIVAISTSVILNLVLIFMFYLQIRSNKELESELWKERNRKNLLMDELQDADRNNDRCLDRLMQAESVINNISKILKERNGTN